MSIKLQLPEFRAWDWVNNKMLGHYEFLLEADGDTFKLSGHQKGEIVNLRNLIPLQFTGLFDKKGNKVFVGDILRYWKHHTCIVAFCPGGFVTKDSLQEAENCGGSMWQNRKHIEEECQVIGNIYQNPGLLK